ncbi:MAG: electron transfer flavoprotein subunit alpha/FixB family protein [Salinisphaeraceae bacterium]|nr:electron transfer flavoprotein subunit alpha/FixB family protein [Salinisphaeraceae bacterium]
MAKILIIAEHAGGELNSSTARAVTCAAEIGGDIDLAVLSDSAAAVAEAASKLDGVTRVLTVERAENADPLAAVLAPQIAKLAQDNEYSHVLVPNTTFGKDLTPRVAALMGVPQVTDIMAVHSPTSFDRPIYAGNAVITVEAPGDITLVGTVRCASYKAAGEGGSAAIEAASVDVDLPTHTRYQGLKVEGGDRPDLQSAPKVVSGGRGVGSEENFKVIFDLADKLGAGVGASRAAVDSGYVPNDMQVGQTGKIIAPELYIACGISGAIQHLAGIKDAGCIVAINSDEDAPIFEISDIGLVGDLFEVLPELQSKL